MESIDFLFPASSLGRIIRLTVTFGIVITLAEVAGKVLKWDTVATVAWAFCGLTIMAMLVAYGPFRFLVPYGNSVYPPLWGIACIVAVGASAVLYMQLLLLNAGASSKMNNAQTFLAGVLAPLIMVGIFWMWNQVYFWFQNPR